MCKKTNAGKKRNENSLSSRQRGITIMSKKFNRIENSSSIVSALKTKSVNNTKHNFQLKTRVIWNSSNKRDQMRFKKPFVKNHAKHVNNMGAESKCKLTKQEGCKACVHVSDVNVGDCVSTEPSSTVTASKGVNNNINVRNVSTVNNVSSHLCRAIGKRPQSDCRSFLPGSAQMQSIVNGKLNVNNSSGVIRGRVHQAKLKVDLARIIHVSEFPEKADMCMSTGSGGEVDITIDSGHGNPRSRNNRKNNLGLLSGVSGTQADTTYGTCGCPRDDEGQNKTQTIVSAFSDPIHGAGDSYRVIGNQNEYPFITPASSDSDTALRVSDQCSTKQVVPDVLKVCTMNGNSVNINDSFCPQLNNRVKQTDLTLHSGTEKDFGFRRTNPVHYFLKDFSNEVLADTFNEWVIKTHHAVKRTGEPNYKNARIKVPSDFNLPFCYNVLKVYRDPILFDYLQFGFPLSLDYSSFQFNESCDNHSSATQHTADVDIYLNKELKHNAMAGPYKSNPFSPLHFSPLLTREKLNDSRRVIVNLSHPYGNSVNSNIEKQRYDNYDFELTYPSLCLC